MEGVVIITGDCQEVLKSMGANTIQCCVTSPPYWGLRDYGVAGQLGLEKTPEEYVANLVAVFREVRRVLRDDGVLWLNLGDSYSLGVGSARGKPYKRHSPQKSGLWAGTAKAKRDIGNNGSQKDCGDLKPKDLVGIPWRVAFALQADGWWLRQDIIWAKPNPMPESVTDRCTKAHEYIFLLTKSARYYYDAEAVKEPAAYGIPNSPESIASPYGQGFTRRADSRKGSKFDDGKNLLNHPNVGPDRKELRSDIESRHRSSIPGGQSMQAEPLNTRNRRSVWTITTKPFNGAKMMSDYVGGDGKPYKLSKDCPVHGHLENRAKLRMGLDDGQSSPDLIRNPDKDNCLVSEPSNESDSMPLNSNDMKSFEGHNGRIPASIDGSRTPGLFETHSFDGQETVGETSFDTKNSRIPAMRPADSLDCLNPDSSEIAILHSKQNHRSTSQIASCDKVSGKIPCHIPDKKQPSLIVDSDLPCDISTTAKCTCQVITCDHFATFPPEIPEICIKAGSKPGDTILDPFSGAGTTGVVAEKLGRKYIGIELNPDYCSMSERRIDAVQPLLAQEVLPL